MKETTNGLTEKMLETLDVSSFIKSIGEFDAVTRKQCILKASKALWKPQVIKLHGAEQTQLAMKTLRTAMESMSNQQN